MMKCIEFPARLIDQEDHLFKFRGPHLVSRLFVKCRQLKKMWCVQTELVTLLMCLSTASLQSAEEHRRSIIVSVRSCNVEPQRPHLLRCSTVIYGGDAFSHWLLSLQHSHQSPLHHESHAQQAWDTTVKRHCHPGVWWQPPVKVKVQVRGIGSLIGIWQPSGQVWRVRPSGAWIKVKPCCFKLTCSKQGLWNKLSGGRFPSYCTLWFATVQRISIGAALI